MITTAHTPQPNLITMERRINARIDAYLFAFKNEIAAKFEEVRQKHADPLTSASAIQKDYTEIMGFIYSADKLKLTKEDFMKRKRIKNVVLPGNERCHHHLVDVRR